MKTLLLLIATLFVAPAFAQMTCTTYLGGVTDCWGAGGYSAEYRQYLGGPPHTMITVVTRVLLRGIPLVVQSQ